MTYDTGDKAIQCGRHNDIFELWLLWRAKVCVTKKKTIGKRQEKIKRGSLGLALLITSKQPDIYNMLDNL